MMGSMGAATKTPYEIDFAAWAVETAEALREGRFGDLDRKNLAEEIEGMARAERKAVRSQLQRLMMHLLKQRLQPERRSKSWEASMVNAREEILDDFEDSPSLKAHLEQSLDRVYRRAVVEALSETGLPETEQAKLPNRCPWTVDELLRGEIGSLS
jgi:Domain of unknown function DUF29